jgi:hypothetical protein
MSVSSFSTREAKAAALAANPARRSRCSPIARSVDSMRLSRVCSAAASAC